MKQLMENWRKFLSEDKDVVEETEEVIEEAEYQGRKVKLNDPIRTPDGPKKFKVFVKDGDKVKPDVELKTRIVKCLKTTFVGGEFLRIRLGWRQNGRDEQEG